MPTRAPADPDRAARRREWVGRAVFESALILLGIIGALAVNEWQTARDRRAQVQSLMSAVRAELQSNLKALEVASEYNTNVAAKFRSLRDQKAATVPEGTHPNGVFMRPPLVAAAWNSAQAAAIVNDVPIETIVMLAQVYERQQDYLEAHTRLLLAMYTQRMQDTTDAPIRPAALAGVLNDLAGFGRGLLNRYQSTLAHLDTVR